MLPSIAVSLGDEGPQGRRTKIQQQHPWEKLDLYVLLCSDEDLIVEVPEGIGPRNPR